MVGDPKQFGRRDFLVGSSAALAVAACGDDDEGGSDTGPNDAGVDVPPDELAWRDIPAIVLTVGLPAEIDFRTYLDDPTGMAAVTFEGAAPAGTAFEGSVLRGTPTTEEMGMVTATATDGTDTVMSNAFTITVNPASEIAPLELERSTPEQIGLYMPLAAGVPAEARATVRYREPGGEYRDAHPLYRINPDWITDGAPEAPVDAFAGTIFDLTPGSTYEVEITIDLGGSNEVTTSMVTTRALPPVAGAATMTVTSGDNLQAALDALTPGAVLELADGTYDVDGLFINVPGTADMPVTVRGASRDGVVLRSPSGRILQLQDASYLVLENLTMEGSGTDSGTDASSRGIEFWNGEVQEFVTFRNLVIRGVDQGIVASGPIHSTLIYECLLQGNNTWTQELIETNATWNDDGIRIPGTGNCAFDNTLNGFGDSLAVTNGVFSAAVYFYRNIISMTGDDACEGDYGTRNMGFYDNYVSNCATLLSLDPLWGGPLYCFRNVCINTMRGPFKLNNTNSGFFIYSNTIVRTEGTSEWGWVQFNNGALRGWAFRNNLLIYQGTTGNLLAVESSGNDPIDFTHNGWFPDGSVWWTSTGGSYGSFEEARAGVSATTPLFSDSTQRHDNDLLVEANPFENAIPLGGDHLVEVTEIYVPTLASGSSANGAGVAIPGITDGYTGAAPDIGAIIAGRPPTAWGRTD